jgi:hypothetical protein
MMAIQLSLKKIGLYKKLSEKVINNIWMTDLVFLNIHHNIKYPGGGYCTVNTSYNYDNVKEWLLVITYAEQQHGGAPAKTIYIIAFRMYHLVFSLTICFYLFPVLVWRAAHQFSKHP